MLKEYPQTALASRFRSRQYQDTAGAARRANRALRRREKYFNFFSRRGDTQNAKSQKASVNQALFHAFATLISGVDPARGHSYNRPSVTDGKISLQRKIEARMDVAEFVRTQVLWRRPEFSRIPLPLADVANRFR
jgi:hypothetical protein